MSCPLLAFGDLRSISTTSTVVLLNNLMSLIDTGFEDRSSSAGIRLFPEDIDVENRQSNKIPAYICTSSASLAVGASAAS